MTRKSDCTTASHLPSLTVFSVLPLAEIILLCGFFLVSGLEELLHLTVLHKQGRRTLLYA